LHLDWIAQTPDLNRITQRYQSIEAVRVRGWVIRKKIGKEFHKLFDDVYIALNNDLGVLAAIGMRTVFDSASELLSIDPNLSLEKKLNALESQGKIGKDET
jgi:hypothetical protein